MSEETLAILRGDAQVATFHFLHHLANMKFSRANVVSSVAMAAGGLSVPAGGAAGKGVSGSGGSSAQLQPVSVASSNAASTKVLLDTYIYTCIFQPLFHH